MPEKGEHKRPEPPSSEQYDRLRQQAELLRATGVAGRPEAARRRLEGMNASVRFLGLGFMFLVTLVLPMGLGYWLDVTFGLLPWLTLAGALLGGAAAMAVVLREVYRMDGTPKGAKPDGSARRTR